MTNVSRKVVVLMMLVLASMTAGIPAVRAVAQDKQGVSQQDKAKACNDLADKKNLKGNDRRDFLNSCIHKATDTKPVSEMNQREKMDACKNLADKKNLKGEDRRSFIKDCMNKANP